MNHNTCNDINKEQNEEHDKKHIKEVSNSYDIEVSALSFSVADKRMLNQVSAQFSSAQIHCILGQNGAGKTTLLKCLSKELTPSEGSVLWASHPLQSLSYAQLALQRAVLSQSAELAFSFTVEQLVRLGVEVRGHCVQAPQIIRSVLQVCDMQHLQERDYLTLSGGEQQRAQLARVLAQIWPVESQAPHTFIGKWLLLDEWTAGLDIKHQQQLARYFKEWAAQGLGIIMVLHDISFAAQLADQCLILQAGKVYSQGHVLDCLTQASLREALEINARVEIDAISQRPFIYPLLESF